MLDLFAEDPIVHIAGPSGLVWRCRRISITDIPAADRVRGLADLADVQTGEDPTAALTDAQEAVKVAEVSGDALALARARDALSVVESARRERSRTVGRAILGDSEKVTALAERHRIWACASVTHASRPAEPLPVGVVDDASGLSFDPVQLVLDASQESRDSAPVRAFVQRFPSDLALIASLAKWGSVAGGSFPAVGARKAAAPDGDDVRGEAVVAAPDPAE